MITVPPPVKTQGKKGRPPNIFVDEQTFNAYKQRMRDFTIETAFAQLAETREAALAVGQVSVAEKIIHDTANLLGANIRKDVSVKGPLIDHRKKKRHRTPSYTPLTGAEVEQEDAYARLEELRIEAAVKHKMETSRRTMNDILRLLGFIPGKVTTLESISDNDAVLSRKINAKLKDAPTKREPPANDHKQKRIATLTAQIRLDEALYEKAKSLYAEADATKANLSKADNPETNIPQTHLSKATNTEANISQATNKVHTPEATKIVDDTAKRNLGKIEKRLIMLEEKLLPLKFANYPRLQKPRIDITELRGKSISQFGSGNAAETEKDLQIIQRDRELMEESFSRRGKTLPYEWQVEYHILHLNYRRGEYRLKYEDKETRMQRENYGLGLFTPFHIFDPPNNVTEPHPTNLQNSDPPNNVTEPHPTNLQNSDPPNNVTEPHSTNLHNSDPPNLTEPHSTNLHNSDPPNLAELTSLNIAEERKHLLVAEEAGQ